MSGKGVRISSNERERKEHLLSLWQQRPEDKRREKDIVVFYRELEMTFPHLLNRRGGDPYQNLESDLAGHVGN